MSDVWVALGSLAGWLAFVVLVVGVVALVVSLIVVRLAERRLREAEERAQRRRGPGDR